MGVGDTFNFYAYLSDDGDQYNIKLSSTIASQGGFGSAVAPLSNPIWPFKARNLRHVWGKATDGHRTKCPCYSSTVSLFDTGGTFTTKAGTYTVTGAIGEKRKANAVG